MRFGLTLALIMLAGSAVAQDARGLWKSEPSPDGHVEIRIANCGASLCGTIENARDPSGVAGDYEHIGRQMVWDMMPNGAGKWRGGKIWDPRNGRTFNSKMELSGNRLKVSGCVLGICQSQNWTRVN